MNKPNYTQIPNLLLDNMADLSHAQFKVMMYICRRTFGFHKEADNIALSQMLNGIKKDGVQIDSGTGMSKQGLINVLSQLEEKGYLKTIKRKNKTTNYVVNLVDQQESQLVNSLDLSSQLSVPQLVNSVDTQKKEKEKGKKDSEQVAYNQKDYLEVMINSEKPMDIIIGKYLKNEKVPLPTKAIAQEAYRRHLRTAKKLTAWYESEAGKKLLWKAFNDAKENSEENNYKFTLETVYKFLTK